MLIETQEGVSLLPHTMPVHPRVGTEGFVRDPSGNSLRRNGCA